MRKIKDYYEKEALLLKNHQREMYFGDPWNRYWHGTRLHQIKKLARSITFRNFLDVGCAEGYYLKLLTTTFSFENVKGVGLDIAKNYLLKAKKEAPESLLVLADAHALPFRENCFDLVLCSEVFEHLLNPKEAFKELVRVSRKYILISVAGENLFYNFTKKLGLFKPEDPYAEIGHGHINELRMTKTIVPWALRAGCKRLDSIVTCYFPLSFLKRHRIPTFFISIIKLADKLINKLPVIKELGSVQIALLRK